MTLPSDTWNLYLILEADASITDPKRLLEILETKKPQWDKDEECHEIARQRKAKRALEVYHEMKACLENADHQRLSRHRAQATAQQRQSSTPEKVFASQLVFFRARGNVCTEGELKALIRDLNGKWDEKQVREQLAKNKIDVRDKTSAKPNEKKQELATADKEKIEGNLTFLFEHGVIPEKSLYAVLRKDASSRNDVGVLQELVNKKRDEYSGNNDQVGSAIMDLMPICKRLFADESSKSVYDNYLRNRDREAFRAELTKTRQGGHVIVDQAVLNAVVSQALAKGAFTSSRQALETIREWAEQGNWILKEDDSRSVEKLLVCGYCNPPVLAESSKDTHCRECGHALRVHCPKCNKVVPTQSNCCGSCGYPIGSLPVLEGFVAEAEALLEQGSTAEARIPLERALRSWPDFKPALRLKERIEQELREQAKLEENLMEMIRESRFHAAGNLLNQAATRHLQATYQTKIDQRLREARQTATQGKQLQLQGQTEPALSLYEQALSICSDLPEAQQGLKSCPPPGPTQFIVSEIPNGFRLQWSAPSQSSTIRYRVLRKANALPNHPEDGEILGEVTSTRLDDLQVQVGQPYHYAVYTQRGPTFSLAAATSGPHLIMGEVEDVRILPRDGEIEMSWTSPPGCHQVHVARRLGTGKWQKVPVTGNRAHDTHLTNGTQYQYRIIALYRDPVRARQLLQSRGVDYQATPVAPPPPIKDLRAEREPEGNVLIQWTPPPTGRTEIRCTVQIPTDIKPGQVIPRARLTEIGSEVSSPQKGQARFKAHKQGELHFIPFTVVGDVAMTGRFASVLLLEEVSRLESRPRGNGIALTWNWPEGAEKVIISLNHNNFAKSLNTPGTRNFAVARAEYDRLGYWEIRDVEKRRHYFTVRVKANVGELCSTGVDVLEPLGQETKINYRVNVQKSGWRGKTVDAVRFELLSHQCPSLHGLVMVIKERHVPMGLNDGLLVPIPGQVTFQDGRAIIPVPKEHWSSQKYGKLYFQDPQQSLEYCLIPAPKHQLVLG